MRLKRRFPAAEVPTSSMADIAFLLIIFFMLTAVFTSSRGLLYQFPKEDPNAAVQPEEAIHIKIVGEGQFLVDRTQMSVEQMEAYIQGKLERNPEKPIIVDTQPDVPYFVMIDVFDLLKKMDVKNVSIPTKTERERWKTYFQ